MSGIVWLASYPKSGNTWVRAFLANYHRDGTSPLDIQDLETGGIASARDLFDELAGVPASELTPAQVERLRPLVYERFAEATPETRFLKIHDAFTRTPEGLPSVTARATRAVAYIVRNPLDVAVSMAFHMDRRPEDMIRCLNDPEHSLASAGHRLFPQLRQRLLTWSGHVESWLDDSGLPVQVTRYEDLLRSPREAFSRLLTFAGLEPDPARVERAIAFSSFETLRAQEDLHGFKERPPGMKAFFRRGRAGDWRNHLTEAQARRIAADHGRVMRRLGYLSDAGEFLFQEPP